MFDPSTYDTLNQRVEACDRSIRQFAGERNIGRDLNLLMRNVVAQRTRVNTLMVECRRLNRMTSVYMGQIQLLDQYVTGLEKRIFWASLL